MRLLPAQDIRNDAIKVLQFFANKHDEFGENKVGHFLNILERDPSLDNIFFFREMEDGSAHRDLHGVHLRRTTDRDTELFRAGSNILLDLIKDIKPLTEGEEADLITEMKRKMPPLLAFIDADRFDSAKDDRKGFMLEHLLLHYNPVSNIPNKHTITCFAEDIMFFPEQILIDEEGNAITIGSAEAQETGEDTPEMPVIQTATAGETPQQYPDEATVPNPTTQPPTEEAEKPKKAKKSKSSDTGDEDLL